MAWGTRRCGRSRHCCRHVPWVLFCRSTSAVVQCQLLPDMVGLVAGTSASWQWVHLQPRPVGCPPWVQAKVRIDSTVLISTREKLVVEVFVGRPCAIATVFEELTWAPHIEARRALAGCSGSRLGAWRVRGNAHQQAPMGSSFCAAVAVQRRKQGSVADALTWLGCIGSKPAANHHHHPTIHPSVHPSIHPSIRPV